MDQAVPEGGPKPAPVVIKKYANRRLYNTATSAYVTLDHLSQMVKDKTDFVVYNGTSGLWNLTETAVNERAPPITATPAAATTATVIRTRRPVNAPRSTDRAIP